MATVWQTGNLTTFQGISTEQGV